jgi:tyrosine-protein phosphatase non-receptor type 9
MDPHIALTHEEQAAVATLREIIVNDGNLAPMITEEMVVQALMARKFEVPRALDLLTNSVKWRREHGIGLFLPLTQSIVKELKTKKIIIPPQSRDKEDSQVVYYKPGLSRKYPVSPNDFCLSVYYLLQRFVRDPLTQRKGFLFICDLRDTKVSQVDRKLVRAILEMLSNKFPARLKKIILLEPPSFFNFAFRIIRPLIPSKYLDKLAVARIGELPGIVDTRLLLLEFGGTLMFDASAFIDSLWATEQALWATEQAQVPPAPTTTPTVHIPTTTPTVNIPPTTQNAFVKVAPPAEQTPPLGGAAAF